MKTLQNPIVRTTVDSVACRGIRVALEFDPVTTDFTVHQLRFDIVAGTVAGGEFQESELRDAMVLDGDQLPAVITTQIAALAEKAVEYWAQTRNLALNP